MCPVALVGAIRVEGRTILLDLPRQFPLQPPRTMVGVEGEMQETGLKETGLKKHQPQKAAPFSPAALWRESAAAARTSPPRWDSLAAPPPKLFEKGPLFAAAV